MAKIPIQFTVTPKNVFAYLLDVGLESVVLTNGKGSIELEAGQVHTIIWRMRGNAGGTLGISYRTAAGPEVVLIKESKIRQGKFGGFGTKDFQL
jgi:hypothetical protein